MDFFLNKKSLQSEKACNKKIKSSFRIVKYFFLRANMKARCSQGMELWTIGARKD